MGPGLEIAVVYSDDDMFELRVRAANKAFSGEIYVYSTHSSPKELAGQIRGFPSSPDDTRSWELGTFDPKYAGGGSKGRLRCADRTGHALAEITLARHEDQSDAATITLNFQFEPASLDRFVAQLEALGVDGRKCAELPGHD